MNQRETQQRLMEVIAGERQRIASRRGFLRGAATAAGGGALALAALPATGGLRAILAQDFADDLEILNYALTLEHLEHAFYRDGLDLFTEEDFANLEEDDEEDEDAVFGETDDEEDDDVAETDDEEDEVSTYARLEEIRDQEQAHVEALTQTIIDLGGEPVTEGQYDFGYGEDPEAFLATAQALENTGVAAYAGAALQIQDDDILAAALSIHSVEARHAAYLNDLNGISPFPDAFDEALTPDEVLEIVGAFIVGDGALADEATPPDDAAAAEAPAEEVPTEPAPTEPAPPEPAPTEVPAEAPTEVPPTEVPAEEPTEEPTQGPPAVPTGTVEDEISVPDNVSVPATSTP